MALKLDHNIKNKIRGNGTSKSNSFDSYLRWAPIFSLVALDTLSVKTKHNRKQQLFIASTAELTRFLIVEPLKKITREPRPMPSLHNNSFPSGHTASSFAGAEIIRQELKDTHPAFSHTGYAMAVATGIFRIYHHKHWISDVVAGAAIGIISARLSYWLLTKAKQKRSLIQESKTVSQ